MDWLKVEFVIAIIMLAITFVLLFKIVSEEITEDIRTYKRRHRWHRWKRKRRKR